MIINLSPNDKIYLTQFSIQIGKIVWLPYSAACVWSYAESQNSVSRSQLGGLFYVKQNIDTLLQQIHRPTIVGFSHYIWNEQYNDQLALKLKTLYPECVIIYGGPQVPDSNSQWYADHYWVDICVHQEGEIVFNDICSGTMLDNVPGISYKDELGWHHNAPSKRIKDLGQLPSPYTTGLFDHFINKNYLNNAIMETDRGCPYRCTFCDWGGATFSKVKRLNLERVFEEIEWAGKNQIEFINNANANFGIFKERDNLIVDKLIETKKKYGYPKTFETSWAKNSNKTVLSIARRLQQSGLLRKFGISMQSLNTDVLKNIKRSNMDINNFDLIVKQAEEYNMSVMVELIVGLPGETLESWKENFCYLMQYNNISVDTYPCWMLYNSELSQTNTVEKFGIKYQQVPFNTRVGDQIEEKAWQIVSTNSLSEYDLLELWKWTWCAILGHTLGITHEITKLLETTQNYQVKTFYDQWHEFIINSTGILNEKYQQWITKLLEYDFQSYVLDYDYMQDIGYKRRQETIKDIKQFVETYYDKTLAKKSAENFDLFYFHPERKYPYTANNLTVDHPGMDSIDEYHVYIGLHRKNKGWQCSVLTENH